MTALRQATTAARTATTPMRIVVTVRKRAEGSVGSVPRPAPEDVSSAVTYPVERPLVEVDFLTAVFFLAGAFLAVVFRGARFADGGDGGGGGGARATGGGSLLAFLTAITASITKRGFTKKVRKLHQPSSAVWFRQLFARRSPCSRHRTPLFGMMAHITIMPVTFRALISVAGARPQTWQTACASVPGSGAVWMLTCPLWSIRVQRRG